MALFGSNLPSLIDDYKPEKPNLFQEFLNTGRGIEPAEEVLVPLMIWFSNSKKNIDLCNQVNLQFFTVGKKILCRKLALNVDKQTYGLKYPKKSKEENTLSFLIPYICKYYGWSNREYLLNSSLIDLENHDLHVFLHKQFAFDKSECRKLGIKIEKINVKYEAPLLKKRGLF